MTINTGKWLELMSEFKTLRVRKVEKESEDAITVYLKQPLFGKIAYDAGQFLTFKLQLDGKQVYRSYSLCSAPSFDKLLSVTIKRVKGGYISNYLNDYLREGDAVQVSLSRSQFRYIPKQYNTERLILLAAGSGITPVLSILKTALYSDSSVKIDLLYGNRNESSILHKKALQALADRFHDRLSITHVLSNPNDAGQAGRLDEYNIKKILNNMPHISANTQYYVCGPQGMMQSAISVLNNMGINEDKVHVESFSGLLNIGSEETTEFGEHDIHLKLRGQEHKINVANGQSLLDAALSSGIEVPYSCRSGFCSACQCQLVGGQTHLLDNNCLTEKEKQQGKVLLCVGYAKSSDVQIEVN